MHFHESYEVEPVMALKGKAMHNHRIITSVIERTESWQIYIKGL